MYDSAQHGLFTQTKSVTVSVLPNHSFTLCVKFIDNLFKQDKEVMLLDSLLDNSLYCA
jgi:hypothetical protein